MPRTLFALLLFAAPAFAQVPGSYPSPYGPIPGPQSFAPNYYNRATQPVSPYLNLLNSTNPALSYYYGVRPGTQGPNGLGPVYGSGAQPGVRRTAGFLPPDRGPDPPAREPGDPDQPLRSPGGAVGYGNVFGSSRAGVGGSRGGFFGGSASGGGSAAPSPSRGGTAPKTIPPVR